MAPASRRALSKRTDETFGLGPFRHPISGREFFVARVRGGKLWDVANLAALQGRPMRQRDNSLSMKSALRNPRTPGTAGRGGLKWSDNLEVRAAGSVPPRRM